MHFGGTCRGRSARGTPRGALLVACALGQDKQQLHRFPFFVGKVGVVGLWRLDKQALEAATPEEEMLRAVLVVACIASASAFGLAPATPALRSAGKASLPLSTRPSVRARALGGATKLSALGNLFGLGEPRCFMCIARIDTTALWHAGFNFCQRRADPFSTGADLLDRG